MKRLVVAIAIPLIGLCLVTSAPSASPDKESRSRGIDKETREGTSPQADPAADAAITSAVKAKLSSARGGDLAAIEVNTEGGTVYLTGTVESAEQKLQTADLVRQVDGVARVVNRLRTRDESGHGMSGFGVESQVPTESKPKTTK